MSAETPVSSAAIKHKVREFFTLPKRHSFANESAHIAEQSKIKVDNMATEEQLQGLLQEIEKLKTDYQSAMNALNKFNSPSAPSYSLLKNDDETKKREQLENENDSAEALPVERHRFIRELLTEIREFDGTSDVEAFLTQIRNAKSQLNNTEERISLVRKIVAIKLKGEAQRVAERNRVDNLLTLGEALRTAFGKLEVEYEQLAEERNAMRQGVNESVGHYICRYEEIDKRIQCSLDSVEQEYREALRRIENKQNVDKFIRGLKKEIRLEVRLAEPKSLRSAFLTAQKEEKYFRDDEALRRRQEYRPAAAASTPTRGKFSATTIPTREGARFSAAVVAERERGSKLRLRTRGLAQENKDLAATVGVGITQKTSAS